ncbi:MAG: nuclear transport factor 2 family protein [Pseudomonadota bacterium]
MKIAQAAFAFILLGSGTALADTKVLDRHGVTIKAGDLEGVMADYAPDAVVVTPPGAMSPTGVFAGKDVRKLFAILTNKENNPAVKTMQTRYVPVSSDTTIMHWVQNKGTPKQVSGHDVFVIRGGKIVFQTVSIDPAKK